MVYSEDYISRIKELIDKLEAIDNEIEGLEEISEDEMWGALQILSAHLYYDTEDVKRIYSKIKK